MIFQSLLSIYLLWCQNPMSLEIAVPFDHHLKGSKSIIIEVELLNGFREERQTSFLIEDSFDLIFENENQIIPSSESMNIFFIKGRKENDELKKEVNQNGVPDFELAYHLYNQDQIARDIEIIRKELLGEKKVVLFGYSSSATILQYYLSLFPDQVERAIFLNPLIFDIQKNLSFPRSDVPISDFKLSEEQIVGFNYFSNFKSLAISKEQFENESKYSLIQFLTFKDCLGGFGNFSLKEDDFALTVRLFEHSLAMSDFQFGRVNDNLTFNLLKERSKQLWEAYSESEFLVHGINYDKILDFQGKVTLIGSAYDQLIYPKSYDALAEFYANSTLLLLKDGHAFQKTISSGVLKLLIEAFVEDDIKKKLNAYSIITEKDFLFKNYKEGDFKIPPPF
ncbi:alpha/beta fold hydrolase [Algoriphagus aestuarii]|nr:alpha/beta fold hydrolase [Algoriphagus aestuarii]